jgi:hypothetical protein
MIGLILQLIFAISLLLLPTKQISAQVTNWQKGVSIEPISPTVFAEESFKRSLDNLAATGANSVALIIPYYQSSLTSTDLDRGWNTPTDEALIEGIKYAHSKGIKVMLKIHPEVKTNEWRGFINPDDRAGWFNNYGNILEHYATLGQENGADSLCLGAEMFKVTSPSSNPTNTENWNKLIDRVEVKFSGSLTYSAQHTYPREAEEIEFWNRLDYIGFAAYFALAPNDPNPSPETLKAAWDAVNKEAITPLTDRWGKPVLFTEIGYRSMDNTHADPWDWGRNGGANEAEQARNYEALLTYWSTQANMAGVYFWKWETDPNAGGSSDSGYTPQNKQAQQTMTTWFGGSTTPTPTPTGEVTPTPTGELTPTPTQEPTPTESLTPTPSEEPEPTIPDEEPTPTLEPTTTPSQEPTPTPSETPQPTPTEAIPTPPSPTVPPQPSHPCCPQINWPSLPSWPALPEPPARPEPPAIPDLSDLMNRLRYGE